MKLRAILLLLLVATTLQAQQTVRRQDRSGAPQGPAQVSVVASGEEGLTIEISGLQARLIERDGGLRLLHNAGAHAGAMQGTTLPSLYFTLGVPYDATGFTATVSVTGQDTAGFTPTRSFELPTSQGPSVTVGSSTVLRGLRVISVRYQPFSMQGSTLLTGRDGRIRVTWKRARGATKAGGSTIREIPSIENTLRAQILNFDQAKDWRRRAMAETNRGLLAANTWGMERSVVMLVPEDAVYSANGAELRAAGASDIVGAPISMLRLRTRNEYLPFHVDDRAGDGTFGAEDRIEFAGRRNPSDEGLYFDAVTDTNAFVLSWQGGEGERPLLTALSGTGDAPALVSYDSTLHFEHETIYFPGPTVEFWGDVRTVHVSERVQNERNYWTNVSFPQQTIVKFECAPHYSSNAVVGFGIRLVGLTNTLHHTVLRLNGIDLGTIVTNGFIDTMVVLDIPASYLINGSNSLAMVPVPPPGIPNNQWTFPDQVNLDYVELRGRWLINAETNAPKLRLPAGVDGRQRVTLNGLKAPIERALSSRFQIPIQTNERGFLFRLTSRQFEVALRTNPGFVAQFSDSTVFSPVNGAGLMLIEANGATGRPQRQAFFNLYDPVQPTAFADALAFLNAVPEGNIVIAGFAVGGGQQGEFPADLKAAFAALGSTKVGGNNFVASWAFAARKGQPATASEAFATLDESNRGVSLDAFIPSEGNGDRYRALVTLEGSEGDVFQMSRLSSPRLRFHDENRLVAGSNQASMIVIAHSAFMSAAQRFAEHRRRHSIVTGDSITVTVVDVERIYDEFNNGVKSPIALRRFLQYADTNWTAPVPGYVLLMGDASWDPMRRLPSSATIDYVPTMGIPSTDYMYTVAFGDSLLAWRQLIGRVPATSVAESENFVDKLIEYDTLPPAAWNKRFVFMAGGSSLHEVHDIHRVQDRMMAEYVMAPPFQGDTSTVWRTSQNLAMPDAIDADWARSEINKGTMWVSFSGHGATDVADLDYGYPEQFNNGNRYFILATFSCQTGAFAEPAAPVRNERFVLYPGRGAIASIGGTSFSYPQYDMDQKHLLYQGITEPPYERSIGAIFANAKYNGYFRDGGLGWQFTAEGNSRRNSLLMYNLLGDPSMRIAARATPELGFTDVLARSLRGEEPAPGDSIVRIGARIWNFGVPTGKSVNVVASITDRSQITAYDTVAVQGLGHHQDLEFELPLTMEAGEYIIRLQADPNRVLATETYLPDNDTSFALRVRGNQPLPIEPVTFGRVAGYDGVVIRLLNPPTGAGAEIEVDTSAAFATSFSNKELGTMALEELTTTWTFSIPERYRMARRFWWRAVSTAGDTSIAKLFPITETFTVDADPGSEFIVGGVGQISLGRITNLANTSQGIGPGERSVPLLVTSMGQSKYSNGNDVQRSFIPVTVEGREHNRPAADGVNLLLIDPHNAAIVAKGSFAFYAQAEKGDVDRFLAMVDTIRPGLIVLLWVNGKSFDLEYRGDEVRAAFRSLGSRHADDFGSEDSYVLIGGKGIDPGSVRDTLVSAAPLRAQGIEPPYYAVLRDTIMAAAGEGRFFSPMAGPATQWRRATFQHTGGSPLSVTVLGVRRDGKRDSLSTTSGLSQIDLSTVDVKTYPRLEFRADFPNDTTLRLSTIHVDYAPSPEIAIVPSTMRMEPDSVLQGDPAKMQATVVNLSRKYAAEHIVARLMLNTDVPRQAFDTLLIERLEPLDSVRYGYNIATDNLRGYNSFTLLVNPDDIPAEPYQQNNRIAAALRIGLDDVAPQWAVYADGNRLIDGDYVSPVPQFEVRIYDNSRLRLDDSVAIEKLILDNEYIVPRDPGTEFKVVTGGEHRASFYYTPREPLKDGEHELSVYLKDASGNADTIKAILFHVERDLKVRNVVNWPNPFFGKTTFTFMVSGYKPPQSGEIGIYTVAGRKIKTIALGAAELQLGFNRVDWDGLDEDRDQLANGVYLYRIRVDNGESTQEVIEKIVVMK